jgi:hypothetical protein
MKKEITLTIHLEELKRIVSGEKKEEYRASKEYYHKMFTPIDEDYCSIELPETITLRCANQNINWYAKIKPKKIRHEQFLGITKPIPENFKHGDIAWTIFIEKVIEHNLNI